MRSTTVLASVANELPGEPVDNRTLARLLKVDPEWIDRYTGVSSRHLSVDLGTGRPRFSLADLCTRAARTALDRAGLEPEGVGLLVLSTATPDRSLPSAAAEVAHRLGLDGVPVLQLHGGTCGPVQGLALATGFVTSGAPVAALVIGGDLHSRYLPLWQGVRERPAGDLVNCVLYGDGAGAAVVTAGPGPVGIGRVISRYSGHRLEPGRVLGCAAAPGGDGRARRPSLREDHKTIEDHAPSVARLAAEEVLSGPEAAGWEPDVLLPPQFGGRTTDMVVETLRMEFPALAMSKEISCVADTGNTGNALVFGQLVHAWPQLLAGASALGISVEPGNWSRAGFALRPAEAP